ncbi:S-adenosyl-L-methionine-dependent methyltransferase [Trema orientale]|uniref:S-adenosyl-L-methionine-dependent methyltransferase n=1 Tax=Trema orientale TaxID=63057 RepID=A0A2P5EHU0_TREOI|nr:S-adenosyl-L-methionine-dependent methyltransferase [Trema orientale]
MAVEKATFEAILPYRFIALTFPNPNHSTSHLRIAVLDSPGHPFDPPRVAAMFVPEHRESDWIFCTEPGHLQLLLNSPGISRLILVGNQPENSRPSQPIYRRPVKNDMSYGLGVSLRPLFLALSPKSCFKHGIPEIPILSYEDNVICSVVLGRFVGSLVGEMLVEDVEIEVENGGGRCSNREFRRRLRFKRMPNLIQTEVRVVPKEGFSSNSVEIGEVDFRPDNGVLVHSYLAPMVASLRLIDSRIEERIRSGFRPKALCLGVGGGALLAFLKTQLGFKVLGVEEDEEVLGVARQYFGLEDGELLKIFVGDAMEFFEKVAFRSGGRNASSFNGHEVENGTEMDGVDAEFDVIMVDLDSCDARNGVSAPPLEFRRKHVLLAARSILSDNGILAINVIPQSSAFYETMKCDFLEVFSELYEIDVGNEENVILIATASPVMSSISDSESSFLTKLRKVISGAFMDSIKKI